MSHAPACTTNNTIANMRPPSPSIARGFFQSVRPNAAPVHRPTVSDNNNAGMLIDRPSMSASVESLNAHHKVAVATVTNGNDTTRPVTHLAAIQRHGDTGVMRLHCTASRSSGISRAAIS